MLRHRTIGLWAGGVAGLAWFGSGYLNWLVLYQRSSIHRNLVNLLVPPVYDSSAPFGALGFATSAIATLFVAVGVAFSVFLIARRFGGRRAGAALLLISWLSAIFVGTAAALIAAVAATIQEAPTALIPGDAEQFLATVAVGTSWGLIAGWVPGLIALAVSHATRRSTGSRRSVRRQPWIPLAAGILVVVLGIALGATSYSAHARAEADRKQEALATMPHSPAPSITAPPVPTETPVPLPSPVADPERCAPGTLGIFIGSVEGALGHRALAVHVTNSGTTGCDVYGYPVVGFFQAEGKAVDVAVSPGNSYMAQDPGAQKIALAPGASAHAVLSWGAGATADDASAVTGIHVASVAGAPSASFPVNLDLADGSTATLTAWQPGSEDTGD